MISPNTILGHYEIISQLGKGGMGEVWRALDTHLNREVAIKVLPADYANNADRLHRFEQEARATSALNHPNILTVHDLGLHEGAPYIVAELLEGEELRAALKRGAIELPHALDYAQQAATGLAAAHAKGIVHRDLKPENLFVTTDGFVKILDFGLAKLRPPETVPDSEAPTQRKITDPGSVMGTASYMSPEQARGQEVDARSDIFSLGVVLYEMIAGQPPFTGVNALDVIGAILNQEPAPLRQHSPDTPAELQRIVSKALRKDREQRYEHVKDLLLDLKDLKQELEFEEKLKGAQPFVVPPSGGSIQTRETLPEGGTTNAQPADAATNETVAHTTSSTKIIFGEIKRHKLGVGVLLAIFVAAMSGLAFGLYKLVGQSQAPNRATGPAPRVVPFTSFPGDECCPSFSPDGNQIAFVWNSEKGENYDIYVKLIDAGPPLRLTINPAEDYAPAWSPDGRYIAFARYSKDERGIFLVPALGGPERALYSVPSADFQIANFLSWSPDGKLLTFSEAASEKEPFSVYSLALENLEKRKLTSPPAGTYGDYYPTISPNGKTLAFTRLLGANVQDIYLMPAAGGDLKRLTYDNRNVDGFAWTLDGREILFASNRTGNSSFWRVSITGGTPEQIGVAGDNVFWPSIARQGNRLAYTQSKLDSNIWRYQAMGGSGRSSSPTRLIASTRLDRSPQYSADGKRIVFISDRLGSREVWVCDSDGANLFQVTSIGGPGTGSPRWSPDGRQIAFDSTVEGQADIYVINVGGGKPRRLTMESTSDVLPSWSRDGKWVYFGSNRTGAWQVWKAPADGGQAVQITKKGAVDAFESPDGRFVYYADRGNTTGIWRTPVAGGEEVQILEPADRRYWAVSERGIYFIKRQTTSPKTIECFSFATERVTQVAVVEKELFNTGPSLSVSPDGRWVLLVQIDQRERDIMLMENFR